MQEGAPWTDLVVVVSPLDGHLYLQERDNPDTLRVWSGGEWSVDGAAISESWPVRRDLMYDLEDGRLSVVGGTGGRRRFSYDEQGQLTAVHWPDGQRILVSYDPEGRVAQIQGPGTLQWGYQWQDDVLRVTDSLGRQNIIERRSNRGTVQLSVQDPLGRLVRSVYTEAGGLEHVEDARGLRISIDRRDNIRRIDDGLSRSWVMQMGVRGEVKRLEMPGGGSWEWGRDSRGWLERLTDPSGRVTRWERDGDGHVIVEHRSGRVTRYNRDTQGRVTAIRTPAGGTIRLLRDRDGYITAITDPLGNRYSIERYAGGLPMRILDPGGGMWSFGVDLQGRPDLLTDPRDHTLFVQRGPTGHIAEVQDSHAGTTNIQRSLSGALTGIQTQDGRRWMLGYDPVGRVTGIQRPDGVSLKIYRDILGEIVGIEDRAMWSISRDGAGRPTAAGPLTWRWGSAGLTGVAQGSQQWWLGRDAAGRLEEVRVGPLWYRFSRDFQGNVISWEGAEGTLTVTRGLSGSVVAANTTPEMTLTRNPSDQLERLAVGEKVWRWLRDAVGHTLRVVGPSGAALGFVRDEAGRITLSRLPSGAMLLRRWMTSSVLERIEREDGQPIREQLTAFDAQWRIAQLHGTEHPRQEWQYDEQGRLQRIQTELGVVYTDDGESRFGPGEAMVLLDEFGRLMEAQPADTLPSWGISNAHLSAFWDDNGVLTELVGDQGVIRLVHDELGRLQEVVDVDNGSWNLQYDILGRLSAVHPPNEPEIPLTWSPHGTLLSIGARDVVDGREGGALLWSDSEGVGETLWMQGGFVWSQGHESVWPRIDPDGQLQLFDGGPIITQWGALEPITQQPTVTAPPLPWVRDGHRLAALWPHALMPSTPWHDPLQLFVELGALSVDADTGWSHCPQSAVSMDTRWPQHEVHPPFGPSPGDLPFVEDPFTLALLCAVLPGGTPLGVETFWDALFGEEAERLDVPDALVRLPADGIRLGDF